MLLYHAVLGRGYDSPFPATRGMVFTTALPSAAIIAMAKVDILFRRYHEQIMVEYRTVLEQAEELPPKLRESTGMTKARLKQLKERVSKRAHIIWSGDQTLKSTVLGLLKNHFYGAFTYFDPTGSRLGASLAHPAKLSSHFGWTSLMEGTADETFIRAGSTGGALIHSLNGVGAHLNYFCNCKPAQLEAFVEKIKNTTYGATAMGSTIVIRGEPGIATGTTVDTLYSLARRVFALGEKSPEKRVKVRFAKGTERDWQKFIHWTLADLINEPEPKEWQVKLSKRSPTSPQNAVLFAARAATVAAFIQAAEINPDGRLAELELDEQHLKAAQEMARFLYRSASNPEGMEKRIKNLKDPKEIFVTPYRLQVALRALEEEVEKTPNRRIARDPARRIPGVTLSLIDELVRRGDLHEFCGVEECQMGKTTRAYTLPKYAPAGDPEDAVAEYEEAVRDFAAHPEAFPDTDAHDIAIRLKHKAAEIYSEHFIPAVSLSRMSKVERRILPKLLSIFPSSFVLRGNAIGVPEPEKLVKGEEHDIPLDLDGINLWVRYRPDGKEFCDWKTSVRMDLARYWDEENAIPDVVPA